MGLRRALMVVVGALVAAALFVLFAPIRFDLDIGLSAGRLRQNAEGGNSIPGARTPLIKIMPRTPVAAGRTEAPDDMLTITITGGTPGSPAEKGDAFVGQK